MQNQLEGCPGHGEFYSGRRGDLNQVSSSSYTFLLLIVLVFVGFYFLMIRPQRRRQQQAQQQQRTLTPGATVRTTAGMYATVSAVDGDDVILEVAPGVDVRYMRSAIMDVISEGSPRRPRPSGDAHDEEYADDDVAEDDADLTDVHDNTESAPEGLADSHDGDLIKSD